MAGIGVAQAAGGNIEHAVEGGGEKRRDRLAKDDAKAVVHLAQETGRVRGSRGKFLHQSANNGRDQRRPDAVAHDVADEDAGRRIRQTMDIEKIATKFSRGQVAVAKAERWIRLRGAGREGGIALGQKGGLQLAGHVEIGLQLGVLLAQLAGGLFQFFLGLAELEIFLDGRLVGGEEEIDGMGAPGIQAGSAGRRKRHPSRHRSVSQFAIGDDGLDAGEQQFLLIRLYDEAVRAALQAP